MPIQFYFNRRNRILTLKSEIRLTPWVTNPTGNLFFKKDKKGITFYHKNLVSEICSDCPFKLEYCLV